ncbi:MAG: hypothetical protein JWQ71_373, partial [Pedosphaera sp.]|nr:hypothetical protein [Pedosphaera sp.]
IEFEPGFFFGDRWHIFQTMTTQINSPKNASSKLIVMIRVGRLKTHVFSYGIAMHFSNVLDKGIPELQSPKYAALQTNFLGVFSVAECAHA